MGIKEIVKTLNARGVRTRLGARFGVGPVHKILTNPIYIGEWRFNRRHAKTGREKPVTEIIAVEVAPIVERSAFADAGWMGRTELFATAEPASANAIRSVSPSRLSERGCRKMFVLLRAGPGRGPGR